MTARRNLPFWDEDEVWICCGFCHDPIDIDFASFENDPPVRCSNCGGQVNRRALRNIIKKQFTEQYWRWVEISNAFNFSPSQFSETNIQGKDVMEKLERAFPGATAAWDASATREWKFFYFRVEFIRSRQPLPRLLAIKLRADNIPEKIFGPFYSKNRISFPIFAEYVPDYERWIVIR